MQPIIGAKETAFLQDLISSKLFLNPFPIGAARSILECYKAKVPVVAINPDEETWLQKPGLASNKIPALLTRLGSANDEIDYINLTKRILYDIDFANQLILEQVELYTKLTDPQRIWDLILDNIPNQTPFKLG